MGVRKELDSVKQLWKNRHELRVEDAGIAAWFGLVRLVVEVSHSLATIGSICLREWQGYGADSSLYIKLPGVGGYAFCALDYLWLDNLGETDLTVLFVAKMVA